jgi:hypothetical protein
LSARLARYQEVARRHIARDWGYVERSRAVLLRAGERIAASRARNKEALAFLREQRRRG